MSKKVLFAIKVTIISALLFVAWLQVAPLYTRILSASASFIRELFGSTTVEVDREKYSYFLIPAVSLILASSGAVKRKAAFTALAGLLLFFFHVLTLASGAQAIAESSDAGGALGAAVVALYHSYGWALPVIILLAFIGDKPSLLWEKEEAAEKLNRCPICGEVKTGLADHIRTAHGEKSLKSRKVRRALGRDRLS